MKQAGRLGWPVGLLLLLAISPAIACPPPLPGVPEPPPPTNEQLAQLISKSSTDIAYGTVTGETGYGAEFRVIHVYRGKLKPGQIIRPGASWGFNPPPCSGMISPPPAFQGMYGVIAYEGEPKLSFVPEDVLKEMFSARLIESARTAPTR